MLAWILEQAGLRAGLPGRRRAAQLRRLGAPRRGGRAVRDRGRRVRHRLLRQAQQVRPLPAAHGDPQQPRVRPRRHLRRPRRRSSASSTTSCAPCRATAGSSSTRRDDALQRVLAMGCWSEVQRFGAQEGGARHAARARRAARLRRAARRPEDRARRLVAARRAQPAQRARRDRRGRARRRRRRDRGARARRASATCGAGSSCAATSAASRSTTTSRTTRRRCARPSTACAARSATARILAVFEPRSNTMKLGAMKAQLPWALEEADLAFCHAGGLGWDAAAGARADGRARRRRRPIDELVARVVAAARAGDHVLCMSNGGFGGIHAEAARRARAAGRAAA